MVKFLPIVLFFTLYLDVAIGAEDVQRQYDKMFSFGVPIIYQTEFELGNDKKFNSLVKTMCLQLVSIKRVKDYPVTNIETELLEYNRWTRNTKGYKEKLQAFWNTNNNDFICPEIGHYAAKHILKMIIDMQTYTPILNKFFLRKSSGYKLNMNAYEIILGEPETIIDYLDKIIRGENTIHAYEIGEIRSLRRKLKKHFNAKTGKELIEEGAITRY